MNKAEKTWDKSPLGLFIQNSYLVFDGILKAVLNIENKTSNDMLNPVATCRLCRS